jgi:hypothetical protein
MTENTKCVCQSGNILSALQANKYFFLNTRDEEARHPLIDYIFGYLVWYAEYFTSDNNGPGGIENATHNTFPKLTWLF